MSRYSFTSADRLCTGCGHRLTAPFLVVVETTPPVSLVAAVHRASCTGALTPAVKAHDGESYALAMITTNPEAH